MYIVSSLSKTGSNLYDFVIYFSNKRVYVSLLKINVYYFSVKLNMETKSNKLIFFECCLFVLVIVNYFHITSMVVNMSIQFCKFILQLYVSINNSRKNLWDFKVIYILFCKRFIKTFDLFFEIQFVLYLHCVTMLRYVTKYIKNVSM